jgi:hypothetical protein
MRADNCCRGEDSPQGCKSMVRNVVIFGVAAALALGFVLCCSGIQFPFFNAKGSLNRHLNGDFGVILPNSAVVKESYWVAARDPEHVFKVEMAPADIGPFFASVQAAAKIKQFPADSEPPFDKGGPAYKTPPWWNNPPLADAAYLQINIKETPRDISDISAYSFLYSAATGTMYVVWGGF